MNDTQFDQFISSLDDIDRKEIAGSIEESLALALDLHRVTHRVREILTMSERDDETMSALLHDYDEIADRYEGRRIVRACALALANACDTDEETSVALDVDSLFRDSLKLQWVSNGDTY